ncbi:hypothetical protein A359_07120 [secondary endosymbiont of Ctenarytaina eucalypti]|uniref:Uncharacterized protein n=1 Tax=secondary endosymbiont of Ctenarytaina eucalypti TaxID=1199245 RepID=J3VSZ9_9ENTR|nr:hypothetical protein A359_07120 [secondary endosymbiont of Ctenarytaina eucalypti]
MHVTCATIEQVNQHYARLHCTVKVAAACLQHIDKGAASAREHKHGSRCCNKTQCGCQIA